MQVYLLFSSFFCTFAGILDNRRTLLPRLPLPPQRGGFRKKVDRGYKDSPYPLREGDSPRITHRIAHRLCTIYILMCIFLRCIFFKAYPLLIPCSSLAVFPCSSHDVTLLVPCYGFYSFIRSFSIYSFIPFVVLQ